MIDPQTRTVLEIDLLLEAVAGGAQCALGARHVHALEPAFEVAEVRLRLERAGELMHLLDTGRHLPLRGVEDLGPSLQRAATPRATLEREEWPRLLRVLEAARDLRHFGARHRDEFPRVAALCAELADHDELQRIIERVFDADGLIRDQASPELARLRSRVRHAENAMRRQTEQVRERLRGTDVLQEEFSTIRNGRHVFPVRAAMRRRLPGIVHGSSNSGETVYIEPLEVIEAANEVELAREAEQEEVRRILAELTEMLRAHLDALRADQETLAVIDGVHTVARHAAQHRWRIPVVVESGPLRLRDAHHPLLHLAPDVESVPVTVALEPKDRVIVVSGPNAGGKTTMMKTVALTTVLLQSGVPVPASPDSTVPVYRGFHADIGDRQDLGEGISTFSGHVRRLNEIIRWADDRALVLLDELGTGTDPEEGGALAVALLEELGDRAALTIATSHLGPVKQWAEEAPGARNASFSLDPGTRRPAFRLRLDLPGASEALVIAENERLPRRVLDRARALVGEQKLAMGDLLRRIEERERLLGEKLREAEARAEALESQERLARQRAEDLRAERRRVRETALAEREEAVRVARERIEKLIADLPSVDALAQRKAALNEARTAAHGEQRRIGAERRLLDRDGEDSPDPNTLRPGTEIFVRAFGRWGTVARVLDGKDKALVTVGGLNVEVAVEGLSRTEPAPTPKFSITDSGDGDEGSAQAEGGKKKKRRKSKRLRAAMEVLPKAQEPRMQGTRPAKSYLASASASHSEAVPMELDLHGFRVEEALAALDKYLDRALISDYPHVRIVHGTGQGRLYRAVHEFLRTHPSVVRFRFGTQEEGGGGVTIVEL